MLRRRRWPWPGAAIDLDFVQQRYFWSEGYKTTAAFTTYTLNASTFDTRGLTPTATIDWTLALAGLGTFIPGAFAMAAYNTSAPGTARSFFQLDDGTANERIQMAQNTTPHFSVQTIDGGVSQANVAVQVPTTMLNVRLGFAASYDTNAFFAAANGVLGTADASGTLPTVTTLRIGKNTAATTQPTGSISRLILFTAVKTQPEVAALSVAMRDGA